MVLLLKPLTVVVLGGTDQGAGDAYRPCLLQEDVFHRVGRGRADTEHAGAPGLDDRRLLAGDLLQGVT